MEGRSTAARLGLVVHMTAPTIHSGYGATADKGPGIITLEIYNYGPFKICVTPGRTYICQLIFEAVKTIPSPRKTTKTFTGQRSPKD